MALRALHFEWVAALGTKKRGDFQRGVDVAGLKHGIIMENVFVARPGGEKVEDVPDADPKAAKAGPAAALHRVDRYAVHLAHNSASGVSSRHQGQSLNPSSPAPKTS
jgi:hypothetical protein